MKIKYSSNGEVSVEGSRTEMENLSALIIEFINSHEVTLCIELESGYDPSPYEITLSKLIFTKSNNTEVFVADGIITFSGEKEFHESVANNLPFGIDETPYHVHYDSIGFPQFLNPDAPEIVFEATH